jgi:hypothetical protein
LAVELGELRLVIEQIELRRRPDHVQVDHALGARRKLRQTRAKWVGWGQSTLASGEALLHQRAERHCAETDARRIQKLAPRLTLRVLF